MFCGINSYNWKSAQVVNSHLVCDPTIRQPSFHLPRQVVSAEPFSHGTGTLRCLQRNGDLQTLICVLVARPRRCLTLSNPVPWQNWMAAYLGYTLWMKKLFRGWPVMVHDTHTRRRRIPIGGIFPDGIKFRIAAHTISASINVQHYKCTDYYYYYKENNPVLASGL